MVVVMGGVPLGEAHQAHREGDGQTKGGLTHCAPHAEGVWPKVCPVFIFFGDVLHEIRES